MKIAITGGAGFIGSYLAKAFLDAGHDVLVIDNLSCGSREAVDPRARFYHVDIRDEKFRTILQMERPDIVSHHAAPALPQPYHLPQERSLNEADIHIRGLLHVLDSCVNAQVRKFIFASGGNDLYGNVSSEQLPIREDTALCPRRSHEIGKVAGEWYVRYYTQHYRLEHTILRYADVYGERRHVAAHHPLSHMMQALLERKQPVLWGCSEAQRDHIFIDDVVQANLLALQAGKNQTLHISSGQSYSLKHLYQLVATLLESRQEPLYLSSMEREKSDPAMIALSNSRAQQQLGWQPQTSLSEGVRRAIQRWRGEETLPLPIAVEKSFVTLTR